MPSEQKRIDLQYAKVIIKKERLRRKEREIMWRKIAEITLWIFVGIGAFLTLCLVFVLIDASNGAATTTAGISGLIGIIAIFVTASGLGMFIEIAKNLESIEKNIREMNGRNMGMTAGNAGMPEEKKEREKQPAAPAKAAVKYAWSCENCGKDNDFSNNYCQFCGTKRNRNGEE